MNEEQKEKYYKKYKKEKEKGGRFWPDVVYKDLIFSFGLLLLLMGFATFVGVEWEPRADPSDSAYIPRPEWYFLFLFEFLKFIPGKLEWVGTTLIPGLAVGALFALPFIDRSPKRHWKNRKFGVTVMTLIVLGMVGLTVRAVITTPEQEESAVTSSSVTGQIVVGQDLYSIYCTECHGPEGTGGEVIGVTGIEDGTFIKSISSEDEMWTRTDETLFNIVNAGQTTLGMPPFGLAFGGELKTGEIRAMVNFMRYTWDERAELPADAAAAFAIPELAEGEVPSYEVHIQAVTKKYCISCHREGKENNNYLMGSYEEMLKTGDNAPSIIAGDMESILLLTINGNEVEGKDGVIGVMPPKDALSDEFINMFELWIANGMPETADEAAALSTTP